MQTAPSSIPSKLAASLRMQAVRQLWGRIGPNRASEDSEFGDILEDVAAGISVPDTDAESPVEVHWSDWRIDLMERLWGQGFLLPGGTDFVHELTKPLSLGSKASVLVLSAGMGGAGQPHRGRIRRLYRRHRTGP
ncbi:MAG: hypothetical protein GKS02_11895 [Alphaproteobacteria bacterium]|nr:hypothetical protein [Alphaproteobacteria bacterium]